VIATRDMLRQMGNDIDAFSYHHYGAASQRCAGTPGMPQTSADAALSEEWLALTDQTLAFYRTFVTSSSRESRCGLPRPPMPPAAEILGLPPS
jgi:hypothetical protein